MSETDRPPTVPGARPLVGHLLPLLTDPLALLAALPHKDDVRPPGSGR
ncbi:hypothetical protein ACH4NF_31440 [Streptomyces sp. NPDC017248]